MIRIFLRQPIEGRCKTRLIPALGAPAATRLYRAMAEDVVATALRTGLGLRLCVAGDPADPWIAAFGLPVEAQAEGDLGARLAWALREGGMAVGSDAPTLPGALLLRAAACADVAFGPAFDGGYTLVKTGDPGIFAGVSWSAPDTLASSVAAARARGHRVELLDSWYDVDEPDDLLRLRQHLRVLGPEVAPRTRAVLAG